ncbi:Hypothetical protein, putative [Bodo saltans]|uniref:Uncharacterized protein n=1 Tax=Bodo saltans TaxID=75058 RepID=A0A0S4IRC3_BODSA|nr:Hypothetical protein, putative [Bodo saltans]|eukprot:CUE78193.1 Hypothetical protein, putative [Bodo saltans]
MLEGALVSWATMAQESEASVQRLRELLHDSIVASEPRKEKECWNAMQGMCRDREQFTHTVRWYTQDIVAALLYLGVESVNDLLQVPPFSATALTQGDSSIPYVSAAERRHASSLLCSIMTDATFSDVSASRLIGGIFPLMGDQRVPLQPEDKTAPPLRATIARALFGQNPRFEPKRAICGVLLDTLLFVRCDGFKGLLMAVLLSDGVERGELVEAVQQLMPLLLRAAPPTILEPSASGGWGQRVLTLEDYHKSVCTQLLGLLGKVSERDVLIPGRPATQRGIQSSDTIEERLHLFLATALNRIVHLPSPAKDSKAFQTAYRLFHSANKFLFGPGFGAFAMQAPKDTSAVEQAVSNLLCLLKGTNGCASTEAVLLLWDKCFPGFLAITTTVLRSLGAGWATSASPLVVCIRSVWQCISHLVRHSTEIGMIIANTFARASRNAVAVTWSAATGGVHFETPRVDNGQCVFTTAEELITILCLHPSPRLMQVVFRSLCRASQQILYGDKSEHSDLHRLVGGVYTFLVSLDIDVVLDVHRIDESITTLKVALTLGPLLFRTSVGLLVQLLGSLREVSIEPSTKSDVILSLKATMQLILDEQRVLICNEVFGIPCDDVNVIAPTLQKSVDEIVASLSRVESNVHTDCTSVDLTPDITSIERHLTTSNHALVAIAAMRLSFDVERAWCHRTPILEHPETISILMRCLMITEDVGVLGHIVVIVSRLLLLKVVAQETWIEILRRAILEEPSPSTKFLGFTLPRLPRGAWDQFTARVFDVQLAVCDDDSEGVYCKSLDALCRKATHGGLADVVAVIASDGTKPVYLRMSALYLIGNITAAVAPLIPMSWVVEIATNCFRLATEETLKSAAAAMLSTLAMTMRAKAGGRGTMGGIDLEALMSIARHLSQYRSNAPQEAASVSLMRASLRTEEEVIRLHGDLIQQEVKAMSTDAFGTQEPDAEVSRLQALAAEAWTQRDASLKAVRRLLR